MKSHRIDPSLESPGLAALMALPTMMAPEFAPGSRKSDASNANASSNTAPLSDVEARFLRALLQEPQTPSSALPKLLRISARRAIEVREGLIARGMLRVHRVNTGSRGRAALLLEPLPPAIAALKEIESGSEVRA